MKPISRPFAFATAAFVVAGLSVTAIAETKISLPRNYRHWFHINSTIVDKTSPMFATVGGFHSSYVSPGSVAMLRNNQPLPDGTILVDDVHEVTVTDGTSAEGARKGVGVMVRNEKKYADTGGWGFQAFIAGDPKKPFVTDPAKQCFACHQGAKDHQYVFSTYIP